MNNQSPIIEIRNEHLSLLSSDVESLWASKARSIQTLDTPPSPIHFLREYVNLSVPVIIKNVFPTVSLDELLVIEDVNVINHSQKEGNVNQVPVSELRLNVDVTPDGHGDTIRVVDGEKMFVMPQVRNMAFSEFRDRLRDSQRRKLQRKQQRQEVDENGLQVLSSTLSSLSLETHTDNDSSKHEDNHDDDEVFYYSRQVSGI